ncbi:hypothetical protein [Nocardioides sp.]|uniref:DUF7144 family membrane protein n=1 Tax=Nocardioides sp. TaxID=35761 RepID=UPI0037833731
MSSNQLDPRSMSEAQSVSNYNVAGGPPSAYVHESAWVVWVQFAGVMIILSGSIHLIQGLSALFRKASLNVDTDKLAIGASYTTWGWGHVIWGAFAILIGVCLLAGQGWARVFGVLIAFVSALANIAFLQANPVWGAIAIAIDVTIIWAIMVHGGELKKRV